CITGGVFPLRGFGAADAKLVPFFLFDVPAGLAAGLRGDAFPLGGDIMQFANIARQCAAGDDLAVVIGHLRAIEGQIAAGQHFTGVTVCDLRFPDGPGVLIFIKVIAAAAIRHDGLVHAVFVVVRSVHL
ncbi:hypothetical protein AM629_21340, partial [Photorhabdus heterorhabditis]